MHVFKAIVLFPGRLFFPSLSIHWVSVAFCVGLRPHRFSLVHFDMSIIFVLV